jgi:hypothetical protein
MKAVINKNPFLSYFLGKAIAYRIASMRYNPGDSGYALFRDMMRDNAKTMVRHGRILKGAV